MVSEPSQKRVPRYTVALAGNPNSGKTTLFNALTGARQHVANYPGVTVEIKYGVRRYDDMDITFVDLPGTYSLTAYSEEERVARDFILREKPDLVVHVVDASNLERNLYLAVQLMEMNAPLLLAFNMADVAKHKGIQFDVPKLSQLLAAPIVPTVATKGRGIDTLLKTTVEVLRRGAQPVYHCRYGREIEAELDRLSGRITVLAQRCEALRAYRPRWLAIKLLENDEQIRQEVMAACTTGVTGESSDLSADAAILTEVDTARQRLERIFGDDPAVVLADRRYGFISGACQEAVRSTVERRHDLSDLADTVLLHPRLGLPIFLGLMYLVFQLTFTVGQVPMGWLESGFEALGRLVAGFWPAGTDSFLKSLLVDGIIGGVGGVIVFLPNIVLLFLAIALLEDSGYMARAAFLMDRVMHRMGLHGKSFIPMLVGFGCSVPAIMATRILENRRNRLTTMMVIPLMSCGARFPIYALIIPAFFPLRLKGLIMWLIYLVGIVLAVICARLLRATLLKGSTVPFVMELPPYRMPTLKGLWLHTWMRSWHYLKKAGTIILAISLVLWAATRYPRPPAERLAGLDETQAQAVSLQYSLAGRIGRTIEPVIRPLGFDWKIGTALVGAMAAKEVFVSQLGIVYALGEANETGAALAARLQADYNRRQAVSILLFCLISAPCMATVAVTRREAGSWKWALLQWFGLTGLAYIVTLMVYQVGSLAVGVLQ